MEWPSAWLGAPGECDGGVASACALWLYLEGWVIFGGVEGTGVGSPLLRKCVTEVEQEVCNTNDLFSLFGE